MANWRTRTRRRHRLTGQQRVARGAIGLAVVLSAIAGSAQSPNPFGQPSADKPQPGASIKAVPGSRAQGWSAQGRSEVLARHGIVATSDPLAAEAGLEILRNGGNAIDAAVATASVLDVTSQNDTGIGGDLFAIVWSAKDKKLYALNSGRLGARRLDAAVLHRATRSRRASPTTASTRRPCLARSPATMRCSSASARSDSRKPSSARRALPMKAGASPSVVIPICAAPPMDWPPIPIRRRRSSITARRRRSTA